MFLVLKSFSQQTTETTTVMYSLYLVLSLYHRHNNSDVQSVSGAIFVS